MSTQTHTRRPVINQIEVHSIVGCSTQTSPHMFFVCECSFRVLSAAHRTSVVTCTLCTRLHAVRHATITYPSYKCICVYGINTHTHTHTIESSDSRRDRTHMHTECDGGRDRQTAPAGTIRWPGTASTAARGIFAPHHYLVTMRLCDLV